MVESNHYLLTTKIKDPSIPKTVYQAIKDPDRATALNTERSKFELNNCLAEVPDTGQHLIPTMWLFSIKTDGTKEVCLIGRGDMMIPWIDFDPNAVYCGNASASSIKIALVIAAIYNIEMRGGDLVGAYLVKLANPDFPVFIKVPQICKIRPRFVTQAIENFKRFSTMRPKLLQSIRCMC